MSEPVFLWPEGWCDCGDCPCFAPIARRHGATERPLCDDCARGEHKPWLVDEVLCPVTAAMFAEVPRDAHTMRREMLERGYDPSPAVEQPRLVPDPDSA